MGGTPHPSNLGRAVVRSGPTGESVYTSRVSSCRKPGASASVVALSLTTSTGVHSMRGLLTKILGDPNERAVRSMQVSVEDVNALEPEMQRLSDDELRTIGDEFRGRL